MIGVDGGVDDCGCGVEEAGVGSGWFDWGLCDSGSGGGGLDSRVPGESAIVEAWKQRKRSVRDFIRKILVIIFLFLFLMTFRFEFELG